MCVCVGRGGEGAGNLNTPLDQSLEGKECFESIISVPFLDYAQLTFIQPIVFI